jgi:hypothetical protein
MTGRTFLIKKSKNKKIQKYWSEILVFLVSFLILFFSFQFNLFHIANNDWFQGYQKDSESFVVGRIVKSRADGISSEGVGLGQYKNPLGSSVEYQYELFINEARGGEYKPYSSQIGIQGVFFSLLDKVFNVYKINDNRLRLEIYHGLTSALLAIVLAIILLLFYFEIGIYPAMLLLLSTAFSSWLIVIANNLYWVFGLMYLPMLVTFVAFKYQELSGKLNKYLVYSAIFLTIFFKSASGYEFLSTVMLAMLTPIIYFSIKNKTPFKQTGRYILELGLVAVGGFISAFLVHIIQLVSIFGSLSEAWGVIFSAISTRTGVSINLDEVNGMILDSLISSRLEVFIKYSLGASSIFLIIFIGVSLLAWHMLKNSRYKNEEKRTIQALLITTWFSFLAPVSWFILAKAHSYIHTNINFVLWDLPFKIFGFALTFYVIFIILKKKDVILIKFISIGMLLFLSIVISFGSYLFYSNGKNHQLALITFYKETHKLKNIYDPQGGHKVFLSTDNHLIIYQSKCLKLPSNEILQMKILTHQGFEIIDIDWNKELIRFPVIIDKKQRCFVVKKLEKVMIKSVESIKQKITE